MREATISYLQRMLQQRTATMAARQKVAKPRLAPAHTTHAERTTGVSQRLAIQQVNVEEVIAKQAVPTIKETRKPARSFKIIPPSKKNSTETVAAAGLAALVITLIPKIAMAGTLSTAIIGTAATPLGAAGLAVGTALFLVVATKHMFAFDKTMQKRNANPGDFTFAKQLATFVGLVTVPLLAGSGMLYFTLNLLPIPVGITFAITGVGGVIFGLAQATRGIIKSKKAADQTITPGFKAKWKQIIRTNLFSYATQLGEGGYIFYRGASLSVLFYQLIVKDIAGSIIEQGISGLGGGLAVGTGLFLITSLYNRIVSKRGNSLQNKFGFLYDLKTKQGLRNVAIAAGVCLTAGIILNAQILAVVSIIAAVAFFTGEAHAASVHNYRAQGSSRDVIQKAPNEYSDTETWQASQRPDSPWINILKPRFRIDEFFVFCVGTLFMREGANWDFLNIFSTMGRHSDLADVKECKRFYRAKQQAILDIVQAYKSQIDKLDSSRLRDKYDLLGKLYFALADHWEKESIGDFSGFNLPGNEHSGRGDVFVSKKANNLERELGKLMKSKAKKFRRLGEKLRQQRLEISEAEVSERLECLERQYGAIFHTFSVNMHRNCSYDSKRSKIRKVDFYNLLTKAFHTGASVLKKNRHTNEYYWELTPCRRTINLDHKGQVLSWHNRNDAEIATTNSNIGRIGRLGGVETFSDLACLDNTRVSDPVGELRTDEGYTYGHMKSGESQTIEFKDGRQKTFHADGRVTWQTSDGRAFVPDPAQPRVIETQTSKKGETIYLFDNGTKQILDQNGEVKKTIETDEVVWVPGMPLPAELEADLPAEWRGADGKVHEDVIRPTLTHFIGSKYQTMLDGEHIDLILSHFLARLEEDLQNPYVLAMFKVPEKVTVPNALHLRENTTDDLLVRVHNSFAPFMIRVKKEGDAREYYIPYNFKKGGLFPDDFWAHVTDVELMNRDDFEKKYHVKARDGHYDRHEHIIVPKDASGNRIRTLSAKALMPRLSPKERGDIIKLTAAEAAGRKIFNELVKSGYLKHVSGEGEASVGLVQPLLEKAIKEDSLPGVLAHNKAAHAAAKRAVESGLVMPYSFFLESPEKYASVEFDRGLTRCGDRHMVAYTFERADKSRYIRWLPKPGDDDWPEIDFSEKHERLLEVKGDKIIVHSCRFVGKRFLLNKHRLGIDAGAHDTPNFEVFGIEGPERFVQGKKRFVLARTHDHTVGGHPKRSYTPFDYKGKDLSNVIDQRKVNGQTLEVIKASKEDKHVVKLGGSSQLQLDPSFVDSVKFERGISPDKVCVVISYKNPYTGEAIKGRNGTQKIFISSKTPGLPKDLDSIYQTGKNKDYLPKLFDQRQKDEKSGEYISQSFLVFYPAKTETIDLGLSIEADENIKLIEVKSSLHIRHITDVAGKAKTDEWIPFDQALPQASKSTLHFNEENLADPFSSGLKFGRIDTMVAPQKLLPRDSTKGGIIDDFIRAPLLGAGNVGHEVPTDDQEFFFGAINGEFNETADGIFSLQYGKFLADAALNTGSNTVMRAPAQDMLFSQFGEELELGAQDEMPLDMEKSLFYGDNITEDAEGAREKKTHLDLDTEYDPTARTKGASVEGTKQAKGQRWRWAAMVAKLQQAGKMIYDEIWRARIRKQIPPTYKSFKSMHEWFNTSTWYFDAVFKHVTPAVPALYMLGLSVLPLDPHNAFLFPIFWAVKTVFAWPKYADDNKELGVSRSRSYFRTIAATLAWKPAEARGVQHIVDTSKGKFETVGPPNGNMFNGWEIRRLVYYFGGVSWATFAYGLSQVSALGTTLSSFGLLMNVVWPGFMGVLVLYLLRLTWMEMLKKYRSSASGKTVLELSPLSREGMLARYKIFNKEIFRPLTVDWFQEMGTALRNARNYYARGEV